MKIDSSQIPEHDDEDDAIKFVAGKNILPDEIDSMNMYSKAISEYFGNVLFFDPYLAFKPVEDVHYYFIYNYLKVLNAYLEKGITHNEDAKFILLNYEFFRGHFAGIYARHGQPKAVNEVSWMLQGLFDYFDEQTQIEDAGLFGSPENLIEYYQSLKSLYEGDPGLYLEVVGKWL